MTGTPEALQRITGLAAHARNMEAKSRTNLANILETLAISIQHELSNVSDQLPDRLKDPVILDSKAHGRWTEYHYDPKTKKLNRFTCRRSRGHGVIKVQESNGIKPVDWMTYGERIGNELTNRLTQVSVTPHQS